MCNQLHKDSMSIPKTGIAYKLFRKDYHGRLLQFCTYAPYSQLGNFIKFEKYVQDMLPISKSGFCGFATEAEAKRALQDWKRTATWHKEENSRRTLTNVILKIKYKQGLGTHVEKRFCPPHGYAIILFKQFQVCDE